MKCFLPLLVYFTFTTSVPVDGDSTYQDQHRSRRAVGGSPANISNYPYLVSLQLNDRHICGGTIISERIILTAAHCTTQEGPMRVEAGNSVLTYGKDRPYVVEIIRHEKFNLSKQLEYDIALLKLDTDIVLNGINQSRVALFDQNDIVYEGDYAIAVGWGRIFLQDVADLSEVPNGTYVEDWPVNVMERSKNGGDRQAGISFLRYSETCTFEVLATAFTGVALYRDWINKTAKKLLAHEKHLEATKNLSESAHITHEGPL
ncbi:hypothetical protein QAD02_004285 [Eretmocerus hayati]|uniref:Uncharacterized protein n=1 Tax=Eretmocerus hayati TaxID=131215 RepID=A0ACC2NRU3_9HYME|nr:hypothetical protein QAD02_004285 [Eretmocerus hayati]